MTPFSALQSLCGLSTREAATYLGVAEKTVEDWRRGRRTAGPDMLAALLTLHAAIENAAVVAADEFSQSGAHSDSVLIEVGYPVDDLEAQAHG